MIAKRLLEAVDLVSGAVGELMVVVAELNPGALQSFDRVKLALDAADAQLGAIRSDIEAAEAPWVAAMNGRGQGL